MKGEESKQTQTLQKLTRDINTKLVTRSPTVVMISFPKFVLSRYDLIYAINFWEVKCGINIMHFF